ncbi:hypothetical protein, partial [Candidatus Binatus sp.]|uniref:hypothetical protein n=1 Tax=Candidatus Binatus sp. TaxID=2811406 RepID=UPI003C6843E4
DAVELAARIASAANAIAFDIDFSRTPIAHPPQEVTPPAAGARRSRAGRPGSRNGGHRQFGIFPFLSFEHNGN